MRSKPSVDGFVIGGVPCFAFFGTTDGVNRFVFHRLLDGVGMNNLPELVFQFYRLANKGVPVKRHKRRFGKVWRMRNLFFSPILAACPSSTSRWYLGCPYSIPTNAPRWPKFIIIEKIIRFVGPCKFAEQGARIGRPNRLGLIFRRQSPRPTYKVCDNWFPNHSVSHPLTRHFASSGNRSTPWRETPLVRICQSPWYGQSTARR